MYDVKIHLKITIYFKKGEDYSYDLNKTDMRRRDTDVFRGGKPVFIFKWIKKYGIIYYNCKTCERLFTNLYSIQNYILKTCKPSFSIIWFINCAGNCMGGFGDILLNLGTMCLFFILRFTLVSPGASFRSVCPGSRVC